MSSYRRRGAGNNRRAAVGITRSIIARQTIKPMIGCILSRLLVAAIVMMRVVDGGTRMIEFGFLHTYRQNGRDGTLHREP